MITERVMQLGDWDLQLRQDTPREIRDKIIGFSEVVIMPNRIAAADMSDSLLTEARYTGVVTRPGPLYGIGGHGLAFWLGSGDRYYSTANSNLPNLNIAGGAVGTTLSLYLAGFGAADTGITVGTITDPTGGSQKITQSVMWISHRELVDGMCKEFGIEWRISPAGVLDAGPYTTLYGTPTAILSPAAGGRNIGYVGIEALIGRQYDLWDYASQVYVKTQAGVASSGGASTVYRGRDGKYLYSRAVYDNGDVNPFAGSVAATRLLSTLSAPQASVRVTSDMYDVTGSIGVGDRVYVYDVEAGIYDSTFATQIDWQGSTIHPLTFRALAARWPVEEGMGILIRRYTGSNVVGDLEYVDITDYVVPESGATEFEIGSDTRFNWSGVHTNLTPPDPWPVDRNRGYGAHDEQIVGDPETGVVAKPSPAPPPPNYDTSPARPRTATPPPMFGDDALIGRPG